MWKSFDHILNYLSLVVHPPTPTPTPLSTLAQTVVSTAHHFFQRQKCAIQTLVPMEPPVWRVQILSNAYACPATEGNAVISVRDQLQLINTNNCQSKTTIEMVKLRMYDFWVCLPTNTSALYLQEWKHNGTLLNHCYITYFLKLYDKNTSLQYTCFYLRRWIFCSHVTCNRPQLHIVFLYCGFLEGTV